ILSHEDERQFTRRLRYVMDGLPQNAKRQSYMYVQEGNGIPFEYETVLKDMATVRSKLPQPAEEIETSYTAVEAALCLEGTLAWVETERAYSSVTITRFGNNTMEAASGAELMCAGAASDIVRTLQEDFRREDIAKGIIKKWEPDTAKYTEFIGNNSAIVSVVRKAKQLLCWLCYLYQNIRGGESVASPLKHLSQRIPNAANHRKWSALKIGGELLPKLLAPIRGEQAISYLHNPGSLPFFTGAEVVQLV
ncbi:unnamed protein product, partial [Cylindrotheca closterium]